ncbi:DNRLRE domain-containing protein [Geodermatophilus sp. DSM 45219]|uniref:DNRLRE domain-containing protein n=1 Tax=Geodermatophilus sp. DSM 45219 TaxID=1881103 RepID=UPI00115FABFD|nr:DNRLRE domain-containing protein [Geodermatophilus sp. DSM 45219]
MAGLTSAPVPAVAAPSETPATEQEAREAAHEQAPRLGDLGDDSRPPEVGTLADLSDPLPDDELGAALTEAGATGERVEIASQTTETSISYAQPDGTVQIESAAGPVRTQVGGEWVEVDTTLQLTEAGVQPLAVTGDITFSAGGAQPMAVLGDGEGTSISLRWPGELPEPELSGDTATYPDVLPGVDLVLTATRQGFTQHLVVNERPTDPAVIEALSALEFDLSTEGATVAEGAGGQLQVLDGAGAVVGTAAAPLMWDARNDARSGEPAALEPIELDLAAPSDPADDATLVLSPPAEFLTDPATVYPVVIDPTQALGALGDTFVQSNIATTPQGGSTELRSGTYDGGATRARGLLRFDVGGVKNRVVQSANLALFETYSGSCSPRWVDIRKAGDFDPNTVTWNNQPWIGWAVADLVGNANAAFGYSSACPARWVDFNLTGWTAHFADTRTNAGNVMALAVTASSETDTPSWKKFASGNAGSNVPLLTVTYDGSCDQYNGNTVCGAVRDKYYALGGPGGTLGLPTNSTAPLRDSGSFNHFQHGSIYFSPATGAHLIKGGTRDKWASLGWENSYLGFPTTDEICGLRNNGCFNHFQGGSIYGSPASGVHTIRGAIRDKWASLGWENSTLGYPTTDHTALTGGAFNHFQSGSIYWSASSGAHTVAGAIRDKWASLGWENSTLGYPTTDDTALTGGAFNHFQGGSIYWSDPTGAHTIRGWIRDKWAQLGWERSYLGYPIIDETAVSGGAYNDFSGGSIYSSVDSGAHALHGQFRDYWNALGATASTLGFPASDQYATDYGSRQDFPGGQIILTADSGGPRDCTITGSSNADQLIGTADDDIICALDGDDIVDGLEGADVILGEAGNDTLAGGLGADSLRGGSGHDFLLGDADSDVLEGEGGDDRLTGGLADDQLRGGAGADELTGGDGADTLLGEAEADTVSAGDGDDSADGGDGADILAGGAGADTILGGRGADGLTGDAGTDVLAGHDGDDDLQGGDDSDELFGGLGQDALTGGSGDDRLDGGPTGDSVDGADGSDACIMADARTHLLACEDVHTNTAVDTTASYVTEAAPVRMATDILVISGSELVADSASATVTTNIVPEGGARLVTPSATGTEATVEIGLGLPHAESLDDARVAAGGTAVYAHDQGLFDVAVQAIGGSLRLATVISSAAAPTRYEYPVALPPGAIVRFDSDGEVVMFAADGTFVGGLAQPWAKSADGFDVPTHYELDGTTLTQVVDHTAPGVIYPVIADPHLGTYTRYAITAGGAPASSSGVAAAADVINCTVKAHNPHPSTHARGARVNAEVRITCTKPVARMFAATSLYRGNGSFYRAGDASTVYGRKQSSWFANGPCVTDSYYIRGQVVVTFPPGYKPDRLQTSVKSTTAWIHCGVR